MKAMDLRVPPEMKISDLIPFLQGIEYAEKFYGIAEGQSNKEIEYEEMEAKE